MTTTPEAPTEPTEPTPPTNVEADKATALDRIAKLGAGTPWTFVEPIDRGGTLAAARCRWLSDTPANRVEIVGAITWWPPWCGGPAAARGGQALGSSPCPSPLAVRTVLPSRW